MSEVNIPLLRKAVEWAEAEAAKPEELCEWEQGYFVAGQKDVQQARRTAERIGNAVAPVVRLAAKSPECGTCFCIAGYVGQTLDARYSVDEMPEDMEHVVDFAQSELNLNDDQADDLFAGGNTIEDVRRIAESIAGERL